MMRILSTAAIAATIALLTACSGSKNAASVSYGNGDPKLGMPALAGAINPFLTNGETVTRALGAIQARAGQPLQVALISANAAGGLTVDVRSLANHGNLVRYLVQPNGTMLGPIPEKLVSPAGVVILPAEIARLVFDPKAVPFERLARMEREALAKSKLPGARVAEWDVGGIKPHDRRVMLLEGAGSRAVVVFDPQFNIVRIRS
jgi:hypothetical protein